MSDAIAHYETAVRWWAATGAALGLRLFIPWIWRHWQNRQDIERTGSLILTSLSHVLLLVFFGTAGVLIPFGLDSRWIDENAMMRMMGGLWTVAAIGCWLTPIALARKRSRMLLAAALLGLALYLIAIGSINGRA